MRSAAQIGWPHLRECPARATKQPGGRFGVWERRRQRGLRIQDPTPISYAGALCEVADRPEVTGSGFKVKT